MNYLLLFPGIFITLAIIYDFIFTTFSPNGSGFLTHSITNFFYRIFRKLCIRLDNLRLLESAGLVIIVIVLAFWYLSIWMGASLIIASDPSSILSDGSRTLASFGDKVYYTGVTLSTLGGGDFSPTSHLWKTFTVILSLMGFALITTGISYMVPVLSAVVNKRVLATYIAMLGSTPQDILQRQWTEDDFQALEEHFAKLTKMVLEHSQQLLAYPVVYCFYTYNPRKSAGLNIAKLDEVLTILMLNIPDEHRPSEQSIYPLRKAISDYLLIQKEYFIDLEYSEPQPPDLDRLREAGIPLKHETKQLSQIYEEVTGRRNILGAIQKDQRRDFEDIYKEDPEYDF